MSKIIDFFKMFSSSSEAELSEEENILNDDTLSKEEKQELIRTLKETDTIAHKLWADDLKVAKRIKLNKNEQETDLKIDSKLINKKRIENEENNVTKRKGRGIAR